MCVCCVCVCVCVCACVRACLCVFETMQMRTCCLCAMLTGAERVQHQERPAVITDLSTTKDPQVHAAASGVLVLIITVTVYLL